MNCCGIILAAGASSRMGRPKALLEYRGETFIDRIAEVMARHCDSVIAVLGYHAQAIREGMKRKVLLVENPQPERGMLSSMQCALRAMPNQAEGFLFTPVDYPAIGESTIARLKDALEQHTISVPQFGGKHGHPVACRRSIADEILRLPADAKVRDVIRAHAAGTVYLETADAGILTDIDDPADYRKLMEGALAV